MLTQNVQYLFLKWNSKRFNNAGEIKRLQFRQKKNTRDRFLNPLNMLN